MSHCNHCSLNQIRRRAKQVGAKVVLRRDAFGSFAQGQSVYVVPKGEKLDLSRDEQGDPSEQFAAWFAEISEGCAC